MEEMLEKILSIEKSYNELGEKLSDPAIIQDYKEFTKLSKLRKSMEETVELYKKWKEASDTYNESVQMAKGEHDPEMKEFLDNEAATAQATMDKCSEEMKILLLPRDPMDDKDIMLEIRGGAGGDEANIFAGDLMRMYLRYAEKQGWKTQILSISECEAG